MKKQPSKNVGVEFANDGRGGDGNTTLLEPGWDPKKAADHVLEGLVRVTGPEVLGAHDAEFVCVGDHAFIVTTANDERPGEHPAWPFCYVTMSVVHLPTLTVEKRIPIARSEQVFENATLPAGACFVPRILRKDEQTLRCYFSSGQPGEGQTQTWFIDFYLEKLAFSTSIHRAMLKTKAGIVPMQPRHFFDDAMAHGFKGNPSDHALYIIDSFKIHDGKTYVGINNFDSGHNAMAVLNKNLDTFEIVGHFTEPQGMFLTENAINRMPDGTWMAICRQDAGDRNYAFATSKDGILWTPAKSRAHVPNGTNSKPVFERLHGVCYLGWQEANEAFRCVFNIDISRDGKTWERKYHFVSEKSFQYPSLHEHNGCIWLTVTQGVSDPSGKEMIMFGKLEGTGRFESQSPLSESPNMPESVHTEDKTAYANDAVVALDQAALSAPTAILRSGLANSASRFLREKIGRVAFLGGSITQMEGWSKLIEEDLRTRFPETEFQFNNAGIGGTNSTFGVFRFDEDILAKYPVDLLFLEFAVNDSAGYGLDNQRMQAMEGIIRKARQANPATDILVLYLADEGKVQAYRDKKEPIVVTHHERIMVHYDIPVINLALEMTRRLDAGLFSWNDFSRDSCHPRPFGDGQYAGCIKEFLDSAWRNCVASTSAKPHPIPQPHCDDHLATARMLGTREAQGWTMVRGWLAEQVCNYSGPVDVLTAIKPGEMLTVPFVGTMLAMNAIAGMDAGVLEISIDGGAFTEMDLFDNYCHRFHRPVFHILANGLAEGAHTARLRVANRQNPLSTGHAVRVLQFASASVANGAIR